jgi:regulatory protein
LPLIKAGLRSKVSDSQEDALQRGLRFLAYRPRSEAEVSNYLTGRGYSAEIAASTLKKLRSLHYLDDETFARDWARTRSESRGYGPKRIEQELRAKGVARSLIQAALLETFGPGNEAEKARLLLERKFRNKKLADPKLLRRVAAFLQRRGYSQKVIYDLLKLPLEDD